MVLSGLMSLLNPGNSRSEKVFPVGQDSFHVSFFFCSILFLTLTMTTASISK